MVQSGCVAKPRAYLATAIRNARKKRQAEASATDCGGYLASWLPDGRKPWEDPPEPEKVEHGQAGDGLGRHAPD